MIYNFSSYLRFTYFTQIYLLVRFLSVRHIYSRYLSFNSKFKLINFTKNGSDASKIFQKILAYTLLKKKIKFYLLSEPKLDPLSDTVNFTTLKLSKA